MLIDSFSKKILANAKSYPPAQAYNKVLRLFVILYCLLSCVVCYRVLFVM